MKIYKLGAESLSFEYHNVITVTISKLLVCLRSLCTYDQHLRTPLLNGAMESHSGGHSKNVVLSADRRYKVGTNNLLILIVVSLL